MGKPTIASRTEDAAMKARYKELDAKLASAIKPSASAWVPDKVVDPTIFLQSTQRLLILFWRLTNKAKDIIIRFWRRRTWPQVVFGPIFAITILIIAAPFVWVLLLHAYHLAEQSWNTPTSKYLDEIAILKKSAFLTNVRNLGLIALGVIGTFLAVWRSVLAHQAHKLSEKGLIIDRFQKGAQMLDSNELSVRLAGIYALRELAKSDPDDAYIMVLDVLIDFVRERSKERSPIFANVSRRRPSPNYGAFPPDLQKAIGTVSWLRKSIRNSDWLEQAHKWNADLTGANLFDADLFDANLSGAILSDANLSFSELTTANLKGAQLIHADLTNASLTDCNLSTAILYAAKLNGAQLDYCDLTNARLQRAKLQNANLEFAELNGTNLSFANLTDASLTHAALSCINFSGAILRDTDIRSVRAFKGWIYVDKPIEGNDEVASMCPVRKRRERWPSFVERVMQENPNLGWTTQDKRIVPAL